MTLGLSLGPTVRPWPQLFTDPISEAACQQSAHPYVDGPLATAYCTIHINIAGSCHRVPSLWQRRALAVVVVKSQGRRWRERRSVHGFWSAVFVGSRPSTGPGGPWQLRCRLVSAGVSFESRAPWRDFRWNTISAACAQSTTRRVKFWCWISDAE